MEFTGGSIICYSSAVNLHNLAPTTLKKIMAMLEQDRMGLETSLQDHPVLFATWTSHRARSNPGLVGPELPIEIGASSTPVR
jgi:hypothetical protein